MSGAVALDRFARDTAPDAAAGSLLVARREVSLADPLEVYATFGHADRFFWCDPGDRFALAACGRVAAVGASGPGRFVRAAEEVQELLDRVVWTEGAPRTGGPPIPLLVGGFAFGDGDTERGGGWEPFGAGELVLPAFAVYTEGGRSWATAVVAGDDHRDADAAGQALDALLARAEASQPVRVSAPTDVAAAALVEDGDAYAARVRRAIGDLAPGALDKVVVARSARMPAPAGVDACATLASLRRDNPACRVFAVGRGASTFLGATPERLLRTRGGVVTVDALAGSAPRGVGVDEDARLARTLLESGKEREEHALVVRAITGALAPACVMLDVPEAPEVRRLTSIQHLHTPIRGELSRGRSAALVGLLDALHPTPAVGGSPRTAALDWLSRHEGLERGWYAGPVGWLDERGDGEMAVALRSALLAPDGALLYAGAGIVPGSEPEAELAETRLKMRAIARALVVRPGSRRDAPREERRGG